MGGLLNNRYAAIDIGSNGVRLLMASIAYNKGNIEIRKDSSIRIPIRLGEDVFSSGRISRQKEEDLVNALQGFQYLIKAYHPVEIRAVATSAMREALNASKVIRRIYRKSKINIEILAGKEEAKTIYSAHCAQNQSGKYMSLLIDVGGGSTETVFFNGHQILEYKSFNLGTVRSLQGKERNSEIDAMKKWLKNSRPSGAKIIAVGTGGNINRVIKILGNKNQDWINYADIKLLYNKLKGLSIEERMIRYKLKSDRADVLVPAINIYLAIMKQLDIKKIIVPGIGLVDGMIYEMAMKSETF